MCIWIRTGKAELVKDMVFLKLLHELQDRIAEDGLANHLTSTLADSIKESASSRSGGMTGSPLLPLKVWIITDVWVEGAFLDISILSIDFFISSLSLSFSLGRPPRSTMRSRWVSPQCPLCSRRTRPLCVSTPLTTPAVVSRCASTPPHGPSSMRHPPNWTLTPRPSTSVR